MSEKRKPCLTMMIRKEGKKGKKLEWFDATLFRQGKYLNRKYRIKVKGKWFSREGEKYSFFTKWEIRDMLWRSL